MEMLLLGSFCVTMIALHPGEGSTVRATELLQHLLMEAFHPEANGRNESLHRKDARRYPSGLLFSIEVDEHGTWTLVCTLVSFLFPCFLPSLPPVFLPSSLPSSFHFLPPFFSSLSFFFSSFLFFPASLLSPSLSLSLFFDASHSLSFFNHSLSSAKYILFNQEGCPIMNAGITQVVVMSVCLERMASSFGCHTVRVDSVWSPCVPNGTSPDERAAKILDRLRSVLSPSITPR